MSAERSLHGEPDAVASTKSGHTSDATDDPFPGPRARGGEGKRAEHRKTGAGNPVPASSLHSELISAQAKAGKSMGDHWLSGEQRQTQDPGWPVSANGRCSQYLRPLCGERDASPK